MKKRKKTRRGQAKLDRISVVHSREEDSPRTESLLEVNPDFEALRDPSLFDERDEGAHLEAEGVLRRPMITDEPMDIMPSSEVSGEGIGATEHSDEATLASYEKEADARSAHDDFPQKKTGS